MEKTKLMSLAVKYYWADPVAKKIVSERLENGKFVIKFHKKYGKNK